MPQKRANLALAVLRPQGVLCENEDKLRLEGEGVLTRQTVRETCPWRGDTLCKGPVARGNTNPIETKRRHAWLGHNDPHGKQNKMTPAQGS